MPDMLSVILPFVSVIIPCRNEVKFIGRTLESLLKNDYPPDRHEIIIVDGISTDGTIEIIEEFVRKNPIILKMLNNPKKISPVAMNMGIKEAKGEIIIRCDAHSEYHPSYIRKCVECLERSGADCVGGPFHTVAAAETLMAKVIAKVTSSPFGVGWSVFRTKKNSEYVDTVPFGCFRKNIFDLIGLYDESLIRNQDNELTSRILKNGGKIYMSSEIKLFYYNQATLSGLLKQAEFTGMWHAFTQRLHPYAFKWRHFLPMLFCLATIISICLIVAGLVINSNLWLFGFLIMLPYTLFCFLYSLRIAHDNLFSFWGIILTMWVFFAYHFVYGYGILKGWIFVITGIWRKRMPEHEL